MKIKLKDLKPNPYKKEINKGILNKEKVELLMESIEKDGFWDNVLCRKSNGAYELAYGHHRIEAAKKVLGGDYYADIPCKDLSDESMLRILGNENCMQNEEYAVYQVDQVMATKKFLEENPSIAESIRPSRGRMDGAGKQAEPDSAKSISVFLGEKNWSKSKVADYIRMHNRLAPKILEEMKNASGIRKDVGISIHHAESIARIPDHQKQLEVAKMVKSKRLTTRETENVVKDLLGEGTVRTKTNPFSVPALDKIIHQLDTSEHFRELYELSIWFSKKDINDYNEKAQELIKKLLKEFNVSITKFMGEKVCERLLTNQQ